MKILLLSAYNSHSHNYWCNLLIDKLGDYDWTFLSLPARKFYWRIRGNGISWYGDNQDVLRRGYDVILATSMVDLAALIGLFPHLGKVYKIIYFHENQFDYPLSENATQPSTDLMMVNLYSALCADRVVFNSEYNRDSFFSGAISLLKGINDLSPVSVLDDIKIKSRTLAVPICNQEERTEETIKNSIIWNHRWEYDKNPEDFYEALKILKAKGVDFKLIMMGLQFRNSPEIFNEIKETFAAQILCWGEQKRDDYLKWLKKGEVIVSTSIHEFQGLAIMDGVQMGAVPIVPARLSYPQWFSKEYLYGSTPKELAEHIEQCFKTSLPVPDLSALTWEELKKGYVQVLEENNKEQDKQYSSKEIDHCINILNHLVNNHDDFVALPKAQQIELMKTAGQLSRPTRHQIKQQNKAIGKMKKQNIVNAERKARAATGIRAARETAVFTAPQKITDNTDSKKTPRGLKSPRNCYICKAEYTQLHFFYDALCPGCAELNYQKRFQSANLQGQVALITGSRLKIGYQSTLMMLRAGATVIATTRFPVDSALRYAKENDFKEWGNRLHIYGLDLRHTPSVEIFCSHIEQTYHRLDLLINNAAQTVRRPPGFYAHLMHNETKALHELPENAQKLMQNYQICNNKLMSLTTPKLASEKALPVTWHGKLPGIGLRESAKLSQIPYAYDNTLSTETVFPKGELDADLQQVDLRITNSWRLRLGEIQTTEMLEIQLVNAVAPFVLCNKLAPLMKKDNTGQKHIVNVSAMEGKFMRFKKGERHPHTNMAKAALNMLTHTSASEFAEYGIFINAIDTGWVTDEDPAQLSKLKQDLHDFQPPLDIVDGAARVCDPFFDGINSGKHWCGKFLKDYFPIDW